MKVLDDMNPHNKEAFQEITKMLEKGVSKLVASRATGSGKTYLMAALAEQYNDDKKLVLEPSNPLLDSIKGDFAKFGIKNTDFMTYQKLIRLSDEDISALGYKLILLDECHHCAAPVWGEKIRHLMDTHSDSVFFGTSATSVRGDGVNVIDVLFEGNVVGELPLSTAIAKGILPVPVYVTALYRLDDELEKLRKKVEGSTNTKDEKKEYLDKIKDMKSHFEKSYGVPIILNKYIKEKSGKYLVFCKDKRHLDAMRDVVLDWFRTAGIKDIHSYVIYSDYPDKEKDYKEFLEDNSDAMQILFSINMLNEGLHIKDISGVLMLRPTMSDIVYRQQLGRVLKVGNLGKHPLVFDLVNNFSSVNDGIGFLKEIKDAVAREKEGDPKFDDKNFVDIDTFFVTDQIMEIQGMFAEIEGKLGGREWTGEEIAILKRWYPIEGGKVIDRLNRSERAIYRQAYKLGLIASDIWTEEEIEIIKKYYPVEGYKVKNRLNGRTKRAIMAQARKLKIARKNPDWTEREDDIIKKYYMEEGGNIYKRLSGRSKNACQIRAQILGITKMRFGKPWTTEDDKILLEYYPIIGTKVAEELNRTKYACVSRAKKLGIKYNSDSNKHKYIEYRNGKWRVGFWVNGKRKHFGTFDNEDAAVKVAMEKAKEYGKAI